MPVKRSSPVRHNRVLFVALVSMGVAGVGHAQAPETTSESVGSATPEGGSREGSNEVVGTAGVETHEAENAAGDEIGTGTEPSEPAETTGATDATDATAPESLVPPGEETRMGPHAVDTARIRFVPGKGLEVGSSDGAFVLRTRLRVQFRYTAHDEDGSWEHQFNIRRARVVFDGHAFTSDVRYKLELAISPNDMGISNNLEDDGPRLTPLLDFYVEFRHLRDLSVRVGQYKIPSNRQRVISSGDLQLVDRALLNGEFTLDRDVGLDLRSGDFLGLDMLRYYLGIYMARGRDGQGFDDFGMMYLARVELLPLGLFDDYAEADFERGGPRLSFGLGWAHIDRARHDRGILGRSPADGGTTDTQHVFADAVFMYRGFSFMTEVAWRHGTRNPGDAVDEMGMPIPVAAARNGYGLHAQAGYLLPQLPVEIAGRYGLVRGLGSDTALGDSNELVVGLSYYAAQHPYKIQIDYGRLWSDGIDEGSHELRAQLQISL